MKNPNPIQRGRCCGGKATNANIPIAGFHCIATATAIAVKPLPRLCDLATATPCTATEELQWVKGNQFRDLARREDCRKE